jgi:hypothetical protein
MRKKMIDFTPQERIIHRERIWKQKLKREYGITPNVYWELYKKQNGVCGICGCKSTDVNSKTEDTKLCVDHCHNTGKVRGLLCRKCNLALQVIENTLFVQKAFLYLGK